MIMLSKFIKSTTHLISLVDRKIRERIDYQKKLQVVSLTPNQQDIKGNVFISYRWQLISIGIAASGTIKGS
jgi:hypothetical protein